MSRLDARDVTIRRGGRAVLTEVSLSIEPGDLLALVGPNGAGKSTLLATLVGDIVPDAGQVTVDDRALRSWRPAELARRRALLPQHSTLAFNFAVRDIVAMGRAPWLRTPHAREDDQIIDESMDKVRHILETRLASLKAISARLIEKEVVDSDELKSLIEASSPSPLIVPGTETERKRAAAEALERSDDEGAQAESV